MMPLPSCRIFFLAQGTSSLLRIRVSARLVMVDEEGQTRLDQGRTAEGSVRQWRQDIRDRWGDVKVEQWVKEAMEEVVIEVRGQVESQSGSPREGG